MPWHIGKHPRCDKDYAVIKDDDGSLAGCHDTEQEAKDQIAALYAQEESNMRHLAVNTKAATVTDQGVFSAVAAAWTVDRMNERVLQGAFANTIGRWQTSGKMIPLHWDHSGDPHDIIGVIDPSAMRETDDGLYVEGKLDLEESDIAREAWRSMKNDAVGLSFGYLVLDSKDADDGVTDLTELDLFEVSITPAPANADTRVLSLKNMTAPVEIHLHAAVDEAVQRRLGEFIEKATDASWDGSPSRFTDEQYARSCVLDRAKCGDVGDMPTKQRYSLPIREPGGALNSNAVHAAAARINQVQACAAAKTAAKNALRRAYGELGEEAPDSLKSFDPKSTEEAEEPAGQRQKEPLRDEFDRAWLDAMTR